MAERLRDAVSPYLRSHADNPVDWWQWGAEPFAEAARRDVPVLVSIGYSTCHWCHVMARESFSDPTLAAALNERFVAIKVDREEHPDVDSSFMAAASAFTQQLGWPLTVFATPEGKAFFAGTYFPPVTLRGVPSFGEVLAAVADAWAERRDEVEATGDAVAQALAASTRFDSNPLLSDDDFTSIVRTLAGHEDQQFGGFGGAPKFPVATVLLGLLDLGSLGDAQAWALAQRTLAAMAASPLLDRVEGGFFRYATERDWSEPHYERMLYDNALLLAAYARDRRIEVAEGIADFLTGVLRLPGGFASGQDSESVIDGRKVEGEYYRYTDRAELEPPALDDKVLTGWNGLAIEALALAGRLLDRPGWIDVAREVADGLLERHRRADGTLLRASTGDRMSEASATLEDYGMLAGGLLELALSTGEVRYAIVARELVDACLVGGEDTSSGGVDAAAALTGGALPFGVPGGPDPVLAAHGTALAHDPSEGAYPSGSSAIASAAYRLYLLTGDRRYRDASERAMALVAGLARQAPVSFGSAIGLMSALNAPVSQLVVVSDDPNSPLVAAARRWMRSGTVSTAVTSPQAQAFAEAGFELFDGRQTADGRATAYLCAEFVCNLPVTDLAELRLP
ncbi:thioredoxin domain-containing protein [Diaminobutyricimonas sp. LJ205]|uniref:thioredoxin domain-containing protein n=1 Tax=Diaminobutyricimonas sp. LJ205 TaxID=2683590 RepID=UPI0012F4A1A6|nr:DUF255 domain-containing protein [Diaminobutyricimonas sp. LJ205]